MAVLPGSPVSPERLRRPALGENAAHTAADTPAETCVHCSFLVDSCMCIRCPWCHSVLFGAQCLCAGSQLDQPCSQATDDGAADLPIDGPSSLASLHAPTNDAPLSTTSTGMSTARQHVAPSDGTSPHPGGGCGGHSRLRGPCFGTRRGGATRPILTSAAVLPPSIGHTPRVRWYRCGCGHRLLMVLARGTHTHIRPRGTGGCRLEAGGALRKKRGGQLARRH